LLWIDCMAPNPQEHQFNLPEHALVPRYSYPVSRKGINY
jgi:hypothetical protein